MSAKITQALHEVMNKCHYVQKTKENAFHRYKYVGEADLLKVLRPAMIEAGLLLLPSVRHVSEIDTHGNVTVLVDYTLAHKDGEVWPEKITAAGSGNDKARNGTVGDKGLYKAITGANKYALFKLFQIETGDDPEEDGADELMQKVEEETRAELQALVHMANSCHESEALPPLWRSERVQSFLVRASEAQIQQLKTAFSRRKNVLSEQEALEAVE